MAVYIDQLDALDLMTKVEGAEWRRRQDAGDFGTNSFSVFAAQYAGLIDAIPHLKTLDETAITVHVQSIAGFMSESAIYGAGGVSRYVVLSTAEICFVREMSPSIEHRNLARKTGFRIWPDY